MSLSEPNAALFAALVEQTEDAIISGDTQGTILSWNAGATRLFGFSANEMIGRSGRILFPPEREGEFDQILARIEEGKATSLRETERLRKDGSTVRVWTTVSPMKGESGSIIGGFSIARDIGPLVSVKREMENVNSELRRICGQLLRSEDLERRRIARDLHDGPVQDLAAIDLNLAALRRCASLAQDTEALKLVDDTQSMVKLGSRQLRTLSYLLHPPLLDESGLGTAVQAFVEGFAKRTGIAVELQIPEEVGRMAPDTELAVFRILQESLANVHRHSGSPMVEIRIARNEKDFMLEVEDRGRGMDLCKNPNAWCRGQLGVGIPGMRERARQLGGELQIDSQPGHTLVRVKLPLGR